MQEDSELNLQYVFHQDHHINYENFKFIAQEIPFQGSLPWNLQYHFESAKRRDYTSAFVMLQHVNGGYIQQFTQGLTVAAKP